MRAAAGIAAALGALAVAGAVAWLALSDSDTGDADVESPEEPPPRRGTGDGSGPRTTDPTPPPANGSKPPDRPRPPPPPREEKIPPPPALSEEPRPGAGLAFAVAGYEEGLAAIDWYRVGVSSRALLEAARDAARDIPRGIDAEDRVARVHRATEEVIRHAQPVFLAMITTQPGGRHETAVEHPAFLANATAAALWAFHRPLTGEQVEALIAATEKWIAAESAHAGASGGPPAAPDSAATGPLALAVARTERLRSFRDAVSALLDEPQRRVIFPETVRDRAGLDLFGPAFGWARRVETLPVPAEAKPSEAALGRVVGAAGPEPPQLPGLRRAFDAWFAEPGRRAFPVREGELSRRGFLTLEESLTAARETISLLDHVAREGGLRPAQVARLLTLDVAVVLERTE